MLINIALAVATQQVQPDPITITGKRVTEQEESRAANRITIHDDWDLPVARLFEPPCLSIEGLSGAPANGIKEEFASAAREAGIKVADGKCAPNVVVMFVSSPQAAGRMLLNKRAGLFQRISKPDVDRLLARDRSAIGWSATEIRSRDGDRAYYDDATSRRTLKVSIATRISPAVRHEILASTLLIKLSDIAGLTYKQLGGYIAMRCLSMTDPDRAQGMESILTLFDADHKPTGITSFDAGYLRSVYLGRGNARAATTFGRVSRFSSGRTQEEHRAPAP